MGRIFVGVGWEAGISPRDLVGAIANEAGVPGGDIRGIDIAERFSLVEVPKEVVDYVIDSLQGDLIRGRRVTVRRDRGRYEAADDGKASDSRFCSSASPLRWWMKR